MKNQWLWIAGAAGLGWFTFNHLRKFRAMELQITALEGTAGPDFEVTPDEPRARLAGGAWANPERY